MCGIAGFYSKNKTNKDALNAIGHAMENALSHRGPDDHDVWQDADLPLVLAHRRLSILDLTQEGHQPKASPSGRYIISYNGEVYNYLEIQQELEGHGVRFSGRSDTEVMLAAFDHWGVNLSLQKFGGMFAFALWDRQEKKLHLVRDRFGKKPLYIGWGGTSLIFASELKAFHQHPDFEAAIDRNVLASYMRFSYICAPYSIFKDVWQLLPGARLTLDLPTLSHGTDLSKMMEPYWNIKTALEDSKAQMADISDAKAKENLKTLIEKCVKQRMISDVPLGAFLSGGIDSSTVVAMMQQLSTRPVKTFSIGFHEQGYDEAQYAREIAEHLGTDHHEYYVSGEDALGVIPKLPDMYDEPFADQSQIPTYLVSQFARQNVTVALSGDGGDEALAGYDRHFRVPSLWAKISWMPRFLRQLGGGTIKQIPESALDRLNPSVPQFGRRMHRLANLIGLEDPQTVYAYLVGHWHQPEQIVKGAREPLLPLFDSEWQPRDLSFAERMIYGDTMSYRPNDLMVKTDRAGMAVSLEIRAPLMDYQIYEYAWQLPHHMKVRNGEGKWILRQILKDYMPESMFDRPKMGFGIPLDDWLRGPLKEWGEDLLSADTLKAQNYFHAKEIRKAWDAHQSGVSGHATQLWTALMFQAWHEKWMGQI